MVYLREKVLLAYFIGVIATLLSSISIWSVWLATGGFHNPIWILVAILMIGSFVFACVVASD